MIAIYARQSLDKKDSISIETQINFCKKEIGDDSEYKIFQDKGFSGKNTSRPAFQELINAVKNKEIGKIIVYRLDRISRSITDFASIIDILEEYKVDFVSANEKFDTSTPVGRAMLYIIMVFAQLERETIAERIKDNYYARGKTGVWLGGPAPLGFTNKKISVGNKKVSTIEPNKDLDIIREIYNMYSDSSSSLGSIAREMLKKHNVMWNNIKLSRILHNPAYVKADADVYNFYKAKKCVIVNDIEEFTGEKGCNLYGKRDSGSNKYKNLDELILSLAMHDGVIDSQIWLRCQYKLDQNKQIKNTRKGKHSWLTGFVKCGYCGYSMNIKTYKDKKYFNCTGRYSTNLCIDKIETHYVKDIENYVLNEMKDFIKNLSSSKAAASNNPFDAEINKLKIELYDIENQIENLINNLTTANTSLVSYANKKILELDNHKTEILEKLNRKTVKELPLELPSYKELDFYDIELKREVANKIINKILICNDKIEVIWKY